MKKTTRPRAIFLGATAISLLGFGVSYFLRTAIESSTTTLANTSRATLASLDFHWSPLLLPAIFAAGIFTVAASRKVRGTDAIDPQEFQEALNIWAPVIIGTYDTPRKLKRYLNRIRLLMSLSKQVESPPQDQQPPKNLESNEIVYLSASTLTDTLGKNEWISGAKIAYTRKFDHRPSDRSTNDFKKLFALLDDSPPHEPGTFQ